MAVLGCNPESLTVASVISAWGIPSVLYGHRFHDIVKLAMAWMGTLYRDGDSVFPMTGMAKTEIVDFQIAMGDISPRMAILRLPQNRPPQAPRR